MKLFICIFSIMFVFFTGCQKKDEKTKEVKAPTLTKEEIKQKISKIDEELQSIGSVAQLEDYIEYVIKNGSTGLEYPGGDMEGGFAAPQDSKDIARYVVTLTGQKSSDDAKADKAMLFYTSNCGGCHGNDGKGIDGNFPNLTQVPYKGVTRLKETLEKEKKGLEAKLN